MCIVSLNNFEMIKQKVYLLPENVDQSSNLTIGMTFIVLLFIDIDCS